jgi:DNA-binding LacI/PurR family transcriptional regulator/anti-anti-sigma regulatory factor
MEVSGMPLTSFFIGASMPQRNAIGFLTPFLGGYYFSGLLAGVKGVADEHGLRVIALRTSATDLIDLHNRRPEALDNDLAWDLVDGWVVVLDPLTPARQRAMAAAGVPRVSISARLPDLDCPTVVIDNRGGAASGVRHLLGLGHRRVAFVGDRRVVDVRERYEGYVAALAEGGVELDPALVVSTEGNLAHHGAEAAQRFITGEVDCSATFAATDQNALGLMRALQAAGRRVPDDLAVVGFDDVAAAQVASPPLTTVRQSFDAVGRAATRALLEQIAGRPAHSGMIYVDTMLVVRHSCGAASRPETPEAPGLSGARWQAALSDAIVRRVLYPTPPEASAEVRSVEASVAPLIEGLAAADRSAAGPDDHALSGAWAAVIALSPNIETLQDVINLLARAGRGLAADDNDIAAAVRDYMRRAQFIMMRERIAAEAARVTQTEEMLATHQRISQLLARAQEQSAQRLDWLRETMSVWGCLGLWSPPASGGEPELLVVGGYSRSGEAPASGQRCAPAQFPPLDTLTAGGGDALITLLPVRTPGRDWGVLALATRQEVSLSNRAETSAMAVQLLGAALEREALTASLEEQQRTLQASYEHERALASAVRELGCPLIPLLPGVLLVPLIGNIDDARAQQILETVLEGVQAQRAANVLLDITGVPVVDTHVAAALIQVARAATLLGAQVTLVGVRPEIAQSIVSLGVDLATIGTRSTLASALAELIRR